MSKPRINPKLLGTLSEEHNKYLNDFISNSKKRTDYFPKIEEFLRYVSFRDRQDTAEISIQDLEAYENELILSNFGNDTIKVRLSALNGFRDYLHENYPNDFGENFLKKIQNPELNKSNEKGRALSLKEIEFIRKYNRESKKHERDTLIFESFFQLDDFKKQYLENDNFEKYDLKELPKIEEIYKTVKAKKIKITTDMINTYFRTISNYLRANEVYLGKDKNIDFYDFKNSHEAYFFYCPNCGLRFECTDSNWCFAKTEFDDEFHLVCRVCKGEGVRHEN